MVIIFALMCVAALWIFSRTPGADEPVKVYEPEHGAPGGLKALFALGILIMALMALFALTGDGSFDTPTFANVRADGGDDAVASAVLVIAIGLLALLALIGGIARKLALIIFLGAVLLSVAMAGGM